MKTLRGGLIGCGFFAENQLHAWRDLEGAEIVALCDKDRRRLDETGNKFGVAVRYENAAEMMRAEQLDFVDIATTAPSHRLLVELAAAHGLPVICQKPFAENLTDARAMTTACEEAGVTLMVHENFRWQAPMRAIREILRSGEIGAPFFGRFSFRSAYDVYATQPYLAEGERFIIEDLGIHILDLARSMMGEADAITCRTARINPSIRGEDVATILLSHASGASSIVDCSYASRLETEPFPETLIEIEGPAGSLRLKTGYELSVTTGAGTTRRSVAPDLPAWGARPWHNIQESVIAIQRHWLECLRDGREPETSGRDNLKTLELVEAAYASAALGETCRVGG